jgi:hypothetical protein
MIICFSEIGVLILRLNWFFIKSMILLLADCFYSWLCFFERNFLEDECFDFSKNGRAKSNIASGTSFRKVYGRAAI